MESMDLLSKQAILNLPRDKEFNLEGKLLAEYINVKDIEALPTVQSQSTAGQLNDSAQSTNLIDRQQALKALRKCQTYLYDARDPELKIELSSAEAAINNLPTIQPVATDTNVGDTISRQMAIDASLEFFVEFLGGALHENAQKELIARFQRLPHAQPDLSDYSDKLWCNAYERGKAEVQSEPHEGHWIPVHPIQSDDPGAYMCSKCKTGMWEIRPSAYHYCPSCGAHMRGEKDG